MSDDRPVGVFDSGVGGLTVLRALQHHLPHESTVYLGDLARCPYGPRPQWEVRRFALQIGDRLAASNIKALVVACNTATAAAYSDLCDRYSFPVIGVIDPGSRKGAHMSRNGRIGVIATDGTVASGAYGRAIMAVRPDAVVVQRSASWLVPIIERGALARPAVTAQLTETLADLQSHDIDTLILGCTHFPIVRDIFEALMGPSCAVVDSAETTASEVAALLADRDLLAIDEPTHRILVNGPAEAFAETAQAMFRSSPDIEAINFAMAAGSG